MAQARTRAEEILVGARREADAIVTAALVKEYRLDRLKERYRPPMKILDGYQWSVRFRYEENSLSSHGANAWPTRKYRDGIRSINDYLQGLVDAASEADIRGHERN